MTESHPVQMLDDELCGRALRLARGVEVTDDTIALDLIEAVGWNGIYLDRLLAPVGRLFHGPAHPRSASRPGAGSIPKIGARPIEGVVPASRRVAESHPSR